MLSVALQRLLAMPTTTLSSLPFTLKASKANFPVSSQVLMPQFRTECGLLNGPASLMSSHFQPHPTVPPAMTFCHGVSQGWGKLPSSNNSLLVADFVCVGESLSAGMIPMPEPLGTEVSILVSVIFQLTTVRVNTFAVNSRLCLPSVIEHSWLQVTFLIHLFSAE